MDLPVRAAILAFELLASACIGNIVTAHHSTPHLIGEVVTLSYVADPWVSYGRFRLENQGDAAVTAAVRSAWLQLGEDRQPLAGITMFDVNQDRMVDPSGFRVDAAATMIFLLGFPRMPHEPQWGEAIAVGLRLSVDGSELQALSSLKFVRRIPSRF